MATMRASQVVAPSSFGEAELVKKGVRVVPRALRIGSSSVWRGTTRGLHAVKKSTECSKPAAASPGAPRADMSDREMPPSHRIKAASISAFQEFQNARANRECFLVVAAGILAMIVMWVWCSRGSKDCSHLYIAH